MNRTYLGSPRVLHHFIGIFIRRRHLGLRPRPRAEQWPRRHRGSFDMTDTKKSIWSLQEEECFFERRRCAPASYRLGKNAANRRRTQQRCPLGTAGVVRYFFRVFRVEAYGISVTRIFFFFVLILSLIQNNRRFHVFDRRARSSFRESPRPDSRDGFETETRVGIGLNRSRSIGSKARLARVKTVRLGSVVFFSRGRGARDEPRARVQRGTRQMLFGGCKN